MSINTAKVANRRPLHFESVQQILDDVERLNPATTKTLGNWSGGQIFWHLGTVINGSIDGAPLRFSWILRMLGRMMKKHVLTRGMKPGFQLKGKAAEFLIPAATNWEEGREYLRRSIRRLQTESKRESTSPLLGPMTREDWDKLHCRHAELHLSFLVPSIAG
jgi:Protein of unknown function (DUF1569)